MNLLIKFPDQSESFTYGVEFGRLLEKIERGDNPIQNNGFQIRSENVQLLKNTCEQYGYVASFFHCEYGGWTNFIGIKKATSEN